MHTRCISILNSLSEQEIFKFNAFENDPILLASNSSLHEYFTQGLAKIGDIITHVKNAKMPQGEKYPYDPEIYLTERFVMGGVIVALVSGMGIGLGLSIWFVVVPIISLAIAIGAGIRLAHMNIVNNREIEKARNENIQSAENFITELNDYLSPKNLSRLDAACETISKTVKERVKNDWKTSYTSSIFSVQVNEDKKNIPLVAEKYPENSVSNS